VIDHGAERQLPYVVCVYNMDGVVHDTLIEHGVERHQPYSVCMEDEGVHCVIERGVERHLLYVVCMENGEGSVCDRA